MRCLPDFVGSFCVRFRTSVQTLAPEQVPPNLPVLRAVDINFGWLKNLCSGPSVYCHAPACAKHSKILKMLGNALLLNALGCPLFATFGVAVMADSYVVIGIDSQISGFAARIDCKLSHNQTTGIISSGTYRFRPQGSIGFDVFEAEKPILRQKLPIAQAFDELDETIQAGYKQALAQLFRQRRPAYLERYGKSPVAEFIVTGFDKNGVWLGKFGYKAPVPSTFEERHLRYHKPIEGQIKIATVPTVQVIDSAPKGFWDIKPGPDQTFQAAIVEKVRAFIKMRVKIDRTVSEPISIAVIDHAGFKFVDRGACDSSANP